MGMAPVPATRRSWEISTGSPQLWSTSTIDSGRPRPGSTLGSEAQFRRDSARPSQRGGCTERLSGRVHEGPEIGGAGRRHHGRAQRRRGAHRGSDGRSGDRHRRSRGRRHPVGWRRHGHHAHHGGEDHDDERLRPRRSTAARRCRHEPDPGAAPAPLVRLPGATRGHLPGGTPAGSAVTRPTTEAGSRCVSAPWPTGAPLAFPSRHMCAWAREVPLLEVRIYQSFTQRSQMTTVRD